MGQAFSMSMRKSITGMHITLEGSFSINHSKDFLNLMNQAKANNVRIFLDVRKLAYLSDKHRDAFKQCYAHIPSHDLIFKSSHSTHANQLKHIGHQGNRILLLKESCKCAGACKSCACQNRAKNRDEKFDFMKQKNTSSQ